MRFLKWLYPGMKIKRWLSLAVAGVLVFGMGAALLTTQAALLTRFLSLLILAAGVAGMLVGVVGTVRSLLDAVSPDPQRELVDVVYQRRHLDKGPKVVAIGGGTGLSTLIQGLKAHTSNITAIVTTADDGGSSGRLRETFGILPPGDIRNCLVALAEAEPLMRRLFQYRFAEDSDLRGHSFGNLFITAMTQITGDFESAVRASSRVLAISGRVIPSTCEKVRLVAEHEDGSLTMGESRIAHAQMPIRRLYLEPAGSTATQASLEAIREADVLLLGPGSLYTSIICNLLVGGVVEAIVQSRALKIYVCNVMTQFRETDDFTASDHVRALVAHSNPGILQLCVVNTRPVPPEALERYRKEHAFPVEPDVEEIRRLGYQAVSDEVISVQDYVRHDPEKLAKLIIQLAIGVRRMPIRPLPAAPRPGVGVTDESHG